MTERRYQVKRWRMLRLDVLRRDLWVCQVVPGCPVPAQVVDHISPVYEGMPDWEFFDFPPTWGSVQAPQPAEGPCRPLPAGSGRC